jgi:hypothetical protein
MAEWSAARIVKLMDEASVQRTTGTTGWEPKDPFDLVVVYEDRATRSRALHLYDYLAQQLLDDHDFQCSWWKCDLLRDAALFEQATNAAADANMIIISVRATADLSAAVKRWIEQWVPRRTTRKSALAALFGADKSKPADVSPAHAYLQRVARLGHMDFFAHTFDLDSPRLGFDPQRLLERERRITPVMQEILRYQPPVSRWGINE